jgi:hypothetical protein
MAFQPVPVPCRPVRKRIAHVLERPLRMVKKLWKKESGTGTEPPTMEAYTEAANKCITSATAFIERARLFAEAKRVYDLWQKEIELVRVGKEIDALKLVIPLLVEPADASKLSTYSVAAMSAPGAASQSLLSVQTAELLSAPFASGGAAPNPSVKSAMTAR